MAVALLLLVLALLAFETARVGFAAYRSQRDAAALLTTLRQLQRDPGNAALLAAIGPAARASAGSLEGLQAELGPLRPLFAATRALPAAANWLADVPEALAVAVPLARVGAVALEPFSAPAPTGTKGSSLSRYMAVAAALAPRTSYLEQQLAEAEAALLLLGDRRPGGPLQPLAPLLARLPELLRMARGGLALADGLAPALGMEGSRTYLLLGQNSGEMRATGGFIGSAGKITLDRGQISILEFGSSYLIDPGAAAPPAPGPMARYLGLGGWYLRDANWWPDFPTTAAQVEQAWMRAGNAPVDGVIALDTAAVEALLRAMGSVEVEGFGTIAADTFERAAAEQLYSQAALSGRSFHQAKGIFLGALGRVLVARLLALSPADALSAGQEVLRLLEEKHLLLALKDRRLATVVHTRGWDGAIRPLSEDSLLIVDTAVSYGDTYPYIDTDATLRVSLGEEGDRQHHELVLTYINQFPRGVPAWMPPTMVGGATYDLQAEQVVESLGFWGNWLRVYLPPDALDVTVEGLADAGSPDHQFGRTLVAGYLALPPGKRGEIHIEYFTTGDRGANEGRYRLFLQKQPGLKCRRISLELRQPNGTTNSFESCSAVDSWVQLPPGR